MKNENWINLYLSEHIKIARGFPVLEISNLIQKIELIYQQEGRIFMFGNGGGANIADHFASDLAIHPFVSEDKARSRSGKRFQIHCLNNSTGSLTRLANDIGLDSIFTEQLKTFKLNKKDLIIAFSTSGNSPNILDAFYYSYKRNITTALIGGRDGGKVKPYCNICILIPGHSRFPGQIGANDNCFHIEDFQTSITHMITGILKEIING